MSLRRLDPKVEIINIHSMKRNSHLAQASLLVSLLLHALLFSTLYFQRNEETNIPKEISIELQPPASENKIASKPGRHSGSTKKAAGIKLTKPLGIGSAPSQEQIAQQNNSGSGIRSYKAGDAFNEMSFDAYASNINFYSSLWNKIRNRLEYPQDFADERIQGLVKVQVTVDKTGQIKKGTLYATSEKKLLEAYSVIGIAYSLRDPLPKNLWNDLEEVTLEIFIDYKAVIANSADAYPDKGNFLKNQFYFVSTKKVRPKVLEKIEYYADRYVPPVIIYPGGFYVDFVQAYRMYVAYTTPDPLQRRKDRVAMETEKLIRLVEESQLKTN